MKIHYIYLFLAIIFFMSCDANSNKKNKISKDKNESSIFKKTFNRRKNNFIKLYTLKNNDSTSIGDIYVRFINDSVFTDLYVVKNTDTLYSIERSIFTNKKGQNIKVLNDGFYGYIFVLKSNDYFVLSYLRNKGANVSDDITIEWNYENSILEKQKLP